MAAAEKLSRAEYDVLEASAPEFDRDNTAFNAQLREWDKRLAAVILQVIMDSSLTLAAEGLGSM
jgi:hypothetical protein